MNMNLFGRQGEMIIQLAKQSLKQLFYYKNISFGYFPYQIIKVWLIQIIKLCKITKLLYNMTKPYKATSLSYKMTKLCNAINNKNLNIKLDSFK